MSDFLKLIIVTTLMAIPQGSIVAVEPVDPKPNVLFIVVDDLRPELGCYGNQIVRSPNIDRLASRGMLFNYAYCQQAFCSPSRSSFLTGRRPDATKVWDLRTHFRAALPDAITLPQYFKANGYYCAALSKIFHQGFEDGRSWSEPHWYPTGRTVDTDPVDWTRRVIKKVSPGIEHEYSDGTEPIDEDAAKSKSNSKKAKPGPAFEISPKVDDDLPDGFTTREAIKRLRDLKAKQKPFFLAVGFHKPHLPFVAPKKYWDLYDPDDIPVPKNHHLPQGSPDFAGTNSPEVYEYTGVPKCNPLPADFAKKLRHGYYACISYIDAQVGKLLDALDQESLSENTIIILWGDHGWQLGEHGLWSKNTNFEAAVRSPLLITIPKQRTAGLTCNSPVEFVDVYPTLAEICGLPVPQGLDGVSLKALLDNPNAEMMKNVAISQHPRIGPQTGGVPLMGYSVRNERWRLTIWRNRKDGTLAATELYDERNDSAETMNLANNAELKEIVERLSMHLPPLR